MLGEKQMARVLNEWMRRYVDEPERFENEMTTVKQYLNDENNGVEPSYGVECAAYMIQIHEELTSADAAAQHLGA